MSLNKLMVASRGKDLNFNIGCQSIEVEEKVSCDELQTNIFTANDITTNDIETNSLSVDGYTVKPLEPIITMATIGGVLSPIALQFQIQGQQIMVSGDASYSFTQLNTSVYNDPFSGLAGIFWELPNVHIRVNGHIEFSASSTQSLEFSIRQGGGLDQLNPVKTIITPSTSQTNTANIESIFRISAISPTAWVGLQMALLQNGLNDLTITNWSLTCQYVSEYVP
jgi:hypothetical protein